MNAFLSDEETNGFVTAEEGDQLRLEAANQSFASNESEKSEKASSTTSMPDEIQSTPELPENSSKIIKKTPKKCLKKRIIFAESSPEIIKNSPEKIKKIVKKRNFKKRIISLESSPEPPLIIQISPKLRQRNVISISDTDSEPPKNPKRKFFKQRINYQRKRNEFLETESERSVDTDVESIESLIDNSTVETELPLDLAKTHYLQREAEHENYLLTR